MPGPCARKKSRASLRPSVRRYRLSSRPLSRPRPRARRRRLPKPEAHTRERRATDKARAQNASRCCVPSAARRRSPAAGCSDAAFADRLGCLRRLLLGSGRPATMPTQPCLAFSRRATDYSYLSRYSADLRPFRGARDPQEELPWPTSSTRNGGAGKPRRPAGRGRWWTCSCAVAACDLRHRLWLGFWCAVSVIAGLGPAIHHFAKKMDAWVEPAHDEFMKV